MTKFDFKKNYGKEAGSYFCHSLEEKASLLLFILNKVKIFVNREFSFGLMA
jgi:hypothetical protein